jgi:cystathionine beta-lyase/cystathionine gamma-synthase
VLKNEGLKPMSNLSIATQLVHAGERRAVPQGVPAVTPIYATSTFVYERMEDVDRIIDGEVQDYVYSRYGNPTVAALEEAMTVIECGTFAHAFGSGMAALHAALLACDLGPGAVVLASEDLYGATIDLLFNVFGAFGVKTVQVDFSDADLLRKKAEELKPRVLIGETLSNPLLKVLDVKACAGIAHANGARLIVDNTFATPVICRPLELGADLVVHSATKYLGGHADATGGVVVAKEEFDRPALFSAVTLVGGILSAWEAHQILRGIKTLSLRLEKQCGNASKLAEWLSLRDEVETVYYPEFGHGREIDVTYQNLHQPYFGAVVTMRLKDDTKQAAYDFLNALRLCTRAASLGDIFTGITHPATATHREMSPARRRKLGITDGLIRISAGIEDVNDIIADIDQALNSLLSRESLSIAA